MIHDRAGEAVGSGAGKLNYLQDLLQAEAEACLHAITAAQGWGMANIVVETDSCELVQAVTTQRYDLSPSGALFREIKAFVSLNFSSFKFVHCPRTCNKIAGALAAFAAKMNTDPQVVWPGGAPTFVRDLLASDVAALVG